MEIIRRNWLKLFGLGSAWGLGSTSSGYAASGSDAFYRRLGVVPILNFRGTHTVLGASKLLAKLHPAMAEASRHYVSIEELQDRVGEKLARIVGTPSAMVTTGAAGAITLGACACLTGDHQDRIVRLPDVTGMKSEVLIQKLHRNEFDHAVRSTGVRLVEVETLEDLRRAISSRTAMMYYLGGQSGDWAWKEALSVKSCLEVLRPAAIPLMVDAANMLPSWENIRNLASLGVDLICISGGKHMCGPQCSGILAGRTDLIRAARLNSSPNEDALGRPFKTGREEIVGVLLAAERYAKLDFEALDRECLRQAQYLRAGLMEIPFVRAGFTPFDRTRKVRRVTVEWDEAPAGLTGDECERKLLEGEPRIAVLRNKPQGLMFTVFMNDPGDEKHALRRMKEIFAASGKKG